jgi:hypothetical protein
MKPSGSCRGRTRDRGSSSTTWASVRVVGVASVLLIGVALAGCGSSGGRVTPPSLSVIRDAARDLPRVTFNGCRIPVDQPTWANILLTRGRGRFRGPYHAAWAIDGKADTSDPQRTVTIPGRGTRLELRVTLRSVGQTFHIEVFNAHGSVGSYSFTNTDPADQPCNRDGRARLSTP